MAMLIRDRFELLTLKCWIRTKSLDPASPGSDAAVRQVIVSQLFHGEQAMTLQVETDLSLIGAAHPDGSVAPTRSSLIGTDIAGQLIAAKGMSNDGILWFHISRESVPLAILPWEAMVREVTDLVLVRIPNFLDNSYRPVPDPSILICASAPIGDGPYALPNYVEDLLDLFEKAAGQAGVKARVHLFVDREVQDDIATLAARRSSPHLQVERPYETPVSDRARSSSETAGRSPWLQWIGDRLKDDAVDIVHFVSPGHFDGSGGAIVLANRPDKNSRHGDIIGSDELIAFYDRLGCAVMGFSSPDMPQWVAGQRALAFELSWLRPGPILLSESEIGKKSALAPAYATLLGGASPNQPDLSELEPIHMCVHPELLHPSPMTLGGAFGGDDPDKGVRPERKMAKVAANYVRQKMASLTETRDLSPVESWEREGARNALNFLSGLVEEE